MEDLSTHQCYCYQLCQAIITGDVGESLSLFEVEVLNYSRWLTLACHIVHYNVSQSKQSKNLKIIVEFFINVCFPSWFDLKANKKLTDGSGKLFNMIQRINRFLDQRI